MNISHHSSVHLLRWFRRNKRKIDQMIEDHMTNEHFSTSSSVHIFCSLRRKENEIDQMIEDHMTDEHFSAYFCSPTPLIPKKRKRDWLDDRRSHDKRRFLKIVRVTYSAGCLTKKTRFVRWSKVTWKRDLSKYKWHVFILLISLFSSKTC
jgi:hypothetical protein